MSRVYNFSAGPAVLPEEVLKEAQEEMLDYRGCGMSVMEMSHRSKVFQNIIDEAEADLRDLMGIPSNYKVLFLQGGASLQFSMIPMNLMKNGVADYIVTGQWAKKAYAEAQKYGKANKIASSEDKTFSYIPDCSDLPISPDADYVYICENNTIYGTKYKKLPNTKGKTLVADVSSCFLSEPVNVSDYGIIYGGVQKNIGPAGMVISIIRDDLITDDVLPGTPTMMKFKTHADAGSLYNTPNCYCIYMCGKVFKWLKKLYLRKQHHLRYQIQKTAEYQGQNPGGRRLLLFPLRTCQCLRLRHHLRRCPEKHRTCRNGHLHYPRRSDHRRCPAGNTDHDEIQDTRRRRLPVQHTELLLYLHVRQSLQMAEENGRPGSYETAQRRESKAAV